MSLVAAGTSQNRKNPMGPALALNLALQHLLRAAVDHTAGVVARASLFWGSLIMLLTTSLWALAFVAPVLLHGSSAAEITFGRFFVYGVISLASLGIGGLARISWRILGVAFAIVGNVAYYFILTIGIQLSGAPLAILIIGMLPITVSLSGRMAADEGGLREIALPLGVFAFGVLTFNLGKTDFLRDLSDFSALGTLCLVGSLAMWTWYAVANARFLRTHGRLDSRDWSGLSSASRR